MDQQFSLSWNNFHCNLSKGFAGLLGKGEFVDVTIAVDGHLLQAHKVILSICSPYFKKMFQLNPCQHPIVVLRDVTHRAMRDLLQFMYHGEVSVKREDLTSFIGTAEVLQIKGLTNKETDDEDAIDSEHELPKQSNRSHNNNTDETEKSPPDLLESQCSEDFSHNSEKDMIRQQEFLVKLQRLSNLKRKSDELLQNSFYNSDISGLEKRSKFKENNQFTLQNTNHTQHGKNYDHIHHIFDERVADITSVYPNHITSLKQQNNLNNIKECKDKNKQEHMANNGLEVKTECEDSDNLAATDSNNSPKSYDGTKDDQKHSIDYHAVQDSALSLVVNETNDSQLPVRYKYIYSRKGHKQLVHMNYVYTRHSTSHGKTSWRCVQYFSLNRCPATVETIEEMLFAVNHHHNHEDCFEKISKNNVYEMNVENNKYGM